MKQKERENARALRRQGISIIKIGKQLGVAKSTVSLWVRDIELTSEHHRKLRERPERNHMTDAWCANARTERLRNQNTGKRNAQLNNPLHIKGCMLYWAEGSKTCPNMVEFCNSDPHLIQLFMTFIKAFFDLPKNKIKVRINCYTNNGLTIEDIENYWLNLLELDETNLHKSRVNQLPSSSKRRRGNRHPYGVCAIRISSTATAQHIFGAIQEYGTFSNPKWLDH